MEKIGISLRVGTVEKYNEKREQISQDWIIFLQKINAIPILIPNNLLDIENFVKNTGIERIVLSGGDNIGDFPERDRTEKEIIDLAIRDTIPILGVCRGMQVINNYFGGRFIEKSDKNHVNNEHIINLTDSFSFTKESSITVNSYHNNIIESNTLGKDLISFAKHESDDTIEGFIHSKYPINGVMWHPERKQNEYSLEFLKKFCSL
tara:strand:- start:3109 stop:3726 length:618 start_codon:yes stop_codon:yes gene_type:complete